MSHAHQWTEIGPRIQVQLTRSACSCGASRLEIIVPTSGRRVSIALPLGLAKAALMSRDVIAKGSEAAQLGVKVLEFLERLRT
jgi:hypothetical protein